MDSPCAVRLVDVGLDAANRAASALTAAFAGDSFWRTIFVDGVPPALWVAVVRAALVQGEVRASQDFAGAICTLGPCTPFVTLRTDAAAGFPFSRLLVGRSMRERRAFLRASLALDKLHHRVLRAPHLYVLALGVVSARQGEGIGRALLASVIERAETRGCPVYLETQSAGTVGFYRRAGFAVAEEVSLPARGAHAWGMVWNCEPRGAGGVAIDVDDFPCSVPQDGQV